MARAWHGAVREEPWVKIQSCTKNRKAWVDDNIGSIGLSIGETLDREAIKGCPKEATLGGYPVTL